MPAIVPGCYAYGDDHLGGLLLRQVRDFKGQDLVDGVLRLVKTHRPLHVSIVGGDAWNLPPASTTPPQ